MATITIYDGSKNVAVEVSVEFADKYRELNREEELNERRETRRHQSLEKSVDNGFDIADDRLNVEETVIREETKKTVHNALMRLFPKQRELIFRVYFNGEKMTDIAKEWGVNDTAIRQRMARAIKFLKKLLI